MRVNLVRGQLAAQKRFKRYGRNNQTREIMVLSEAGEVTKFLTSVFLYSFTCIHKKRTHFILFTLLNDGSSFNLLTLGSMGCRRISAPQKSFVQAHCEAAIYGVYIGDDATK